MVNPYVAFTAKEGNATIHDLCTSGYTLSKGNTLGYSARVLTPLDNGRTRSTYAVASWAKKQAGCAISQKSVKISGDDCLDGLYSAQYGCEFLSLRSGIVCDVTNLLLIGDGNNFLRFGGGYVISYLNRGCVVWEVFAHIS